MINHCGACNKSYPGDAECCPFCGHESKAAARSILESSSDSAVGRKSRVRWLPPEHPEASSRLRAASHKDCEPASRAEDNSGNSSEFDRLNMDAPRAQSGAGLPASPATLPLEGTGSSNIRAGQQDTSGFPNGSGLRVEDPAGGNGASNDGNAVRDPAVSSGDNGQVECTPAVSGSNETVLQIKISDI
jgi:hypothetical protein